MDLMQQPPGHEPRPDPAAREAQAWVRRLTSGKARTGDARALQQWCRASDANQRAFSAAYRRYAAVKQAAALAAADDPALAAWRQPPPVAPAIALGRRRFVAGGMALASAAAVGLLVVRPPLALWPSLQALQADYKTGTGEQRALALGEGLRVELNTRSSLSVRTGNGSGQALGVDLIEGQVAIDIAGKSAPFSVYAGGGSVQAVDASFEVQHVDGGVCVTCIDGLVQVALKGDRLNLGPGQQLRYGASGLQPVRPVDTASVTAWREGLLNFQRTALVQVIEEINRYRPGRVILLSKQLEGRPVSGQFHLDDLGKAIVQIQRLFKLDMTALPGGIVVLS